MFGQEEAVFGYKGLDISLSFASHNLEPHVDISWQEKWEQSGDIKASDIAAALKDFLPEAAFEHQSKPSQLSDTDISNYKPPGQNISTYSIGDRHFEIWCEPLTNTFARQIMKNAQVLVPLFIEGGTEIDLEQDWVRERWTVFLHYEVYSESEPGTAPYALIGFSTAFRLFTLPDRANPDPANPDTTLLDLLASDKQSKLNDGLEWQSRDFPSRQRISQFLILPPYQGSGHGPHLYNAMYTHLISEDKVLELTVEDPNEAFDDMRDACDLVHLREHNSDFSCLKINTNIDGSAMRPNASIPVDQIIDVELKNRIKKASKIMPRQLARLIEMQTLSSIPSVNRNTARISRKEKSSNEHDRAYYFWRLYVKQRLYETHLDTLKELDSEERIDKLEATVNTVEDDYVRLLALADKQAQRMMSQGKKKKDRKRKSVVDDEDEDGHDGLPTAETFKKTRIAAH